VLAASSSAFDPLQTYAPRAKFEYSLHLSSIGSNSRDCPCPDLNDIEMPSALLTEAFPAKQRSHFS